MLNKWSFVVLIAAFLAGCMTTQLKKQESKTVVYKLEESSSWGYLDSGKPIKAGGFSGLFYVAHMSTAANIYLWTLTDRGPNGESFKDEKGLHYRPFFSPSYQPQLLLLKVDRQNNKMTIVEKVKLFSAQGKPLTGLPPHPAHLKNGYDEIPVDGSKKVLAADVNGIDPEGITKDEEGNFWISEEYRPSVMKFSRQGKLIKRFVPLGTEKNSAFVKDILPATLKNRQMNRGFEGVTYGHGKVWALLQSPLESEKKIEPSFLRLVEIDTKTELLTGEYKIHLPNPKVDKVGDLTYVPEEDKFYFVLQNSKVNQDGAHLVYSFKRQDLVRIDKEIHPELMFDLNQQNFGNHEKVEGLAYLGQKEWAVVNDNDFNVPSEEEMPTFLGIIKP